MVRVNGELSDSLTSAFGVAQGECLSSFLFSIYLNDLEETLELSGFDGIGMGMLKLYILLYADDIILFSENEEGLQKGLNILHSYCQKSKLTVNVSKSKVMVFRKGGRLSDKIFTYNNEILDIVPYFNYLGITISSGGTFSHARAGVKGYL